MFKYYHLTKKMRWQVKIDYDRIFWNPDNQNDGDLESVAQPLILRGLSLLLYIAQISSVTTYKNYTKNIMTLFVIVIKMQTTSK